MVIQVENLEKKYGQKTVCSNVSLTVREGEIFGILGPNGAGKTTLIRCIMSVIKTDSGTVKIFQQLMHPGANEVKRNIGFVPQNTALFEELTVYDNIVYFCSLYHKNRKEARWMAEEAMIRLGLEDYRKFSPKKLSGGLQKRLHLACGIAHHPKLLILDELTVGADIQSKVKIIEVIQQLNKEGTSILYGIHYGEEVEELCHRFAIMDRGKVLAVGSKEELVAMISLGESVSMKVEGITSKMVEDMQLIPNIFDIKRKQQIIKMKCKKDKDNINRIISYLQEQGLSYDWIHTELPSLEDVFSEITGRKIRE